MATKLNTVSPARNPAHDFSRSPSIDIERSTFQRDSSHKTTLLGGGALIPIFLDEALPADTWSMDMNSLIRMTTPLVPFMDNVYATVHFWCVPKRLLWDHFEDFICGKLSDDGVALRYEYPFTPIEPSNLKSNVLTDYFGLPVYGSRTFETFIGPSGDEPPFEVNELPFRAYNLIWNEWYRQDHIQEFAPFTKGDAPLFPLSTQTDSSIAESEKFYHILKRGKRHDYFTSALPYPQLGPAVTLPLGGTAPVMGNGEPIGLVLMTNNKTYNLKNSNAASSVVLGTGTYDSNATNSSGTLTTSGNLRFSQNNASSTGLVTDLSDATAISINDLREAFQLQRMFERDARSGGQRYTEVLLAHFKTISPDGRLQRPEYLGGNTFRFIVSPLAQTSGTTATDGNSTPQGNLAAVSACTGEVRWSHSFTEHCYVMGLIEISTDLTYQQGINKMWKRRTRYDEYWPVFAHLGEQPIRMDEIYCTGTSRDNEIFGYQERYAEFRYRPSMITGDFRTESLNGSMDFWHLGQYFTERPNLNAKFIEDDPPFARVSALSEQEHPPFMADFAFNLKCTRPLPLYSVPGLVDHY